MPRFFSYFWRGFRNICPNEIALIIFDVVTITVAPRQLFDCYLWAVIALCDIAVITSHGAWLEHRCAMPIGQTHPWQRTESFVLRAVILFSLSVGLGYDYITHNFATVQTELWHVATYCWYITVFVAVYESFYCILKTLNAIDHSWLEGTKGHIGVPNAISVIRIGLALSIPHIYVTQSFGTHSDALATIILGAALGTDAIDGYIARSCNQTTKAGKALDPLGDKLIFYPVAVGFFIYTQNRLINPKDVFPDIYIWIAASLIALRDVLIIIWFALFYKKHAGGVSAGLADKLRTIVLSAWLVSTALAIATAETELGYDMSWISCISLFIAGILSPLSFIIDICRIRAIRKKEAQAAYEVSHKKPPRY